MKYTDLCIATEGLLRDKVEYENIDLIASGLPIKILCIDSVDDSIIRKIANKYHCGKYFTIDFSQFIEYVRSDIELDRVTTASDQILRKILEECAGNIGKLNHKPSIRETWNILYPRLLYYNQATKIQLFIIFHDPLAYTYTMIPRLPTILINLGYLTRYKNGNKSFDLYKYRNLQYKQVFQNKPPRSYYINPSGLTLYHVSPTPDIKILKPMPPKHPLNREALGLYENIRIPRISCSPTVEGCFSGAWFAYDDVFIAYVYKLILTTSSKVVKPDEWLVPDYKESNEYWVLTPTTVIQIDTVKVEQDKSDPTLVHFTSLTKPGK